MEHYFTSCWPQLGLCPHSLGWGVSAEPASPSQSDMCLLLVLVPSGISSAQVLMPRVVGTMQATPVLGSLSEQTGQDGSCSALSRFILPKLCSCGDLVNQTAQIQCRHGFAHVGQQLQAFHPTPLSMLYEQWQWAEIRDEEKSVAKAEEGDCDLFLWLQEGFPVIAKLCVAFWG